MTLSAEFTNVRRSSCATEESHDWRQCFSASLAMEHGSWNEMKNIIDSKKSPFEGINMWNSHLKSFGLGDYLGYDLNIGRPGFVPDGDYYNFWYPEKNWGSVTTISNSIIIKEFSFSYFSHFVRFKKFRLFFAFKFLMVFFNLLGWEDK